MLTMHAVFAGLLAVWSLVRVRRAVALTLAGMLLAGAVFPQPAQAQFGLGGLFSAINGVLDTINNVIRGLLNAANNVLSQISSVMQAFRQLMETVVYPQDLIARARGMVASMIGAFRGLLSSIFNISVASAQLPSPGQLEGIIRNRSAGDFGALSQAYVSTYGPLPAATDADPMDRDLIDMDDATAQAQLKTLKASDAISDQTITTSLLMEDEARLAAPGTAHYVLAAGVIAAIQNQAVMQKMLAAQMRQEAARLAHRNMIWKRNAMFGSQLRQDMSTLLNRR